VRSCDSRRLPISGPIGKSCSGVAQDRFAARPPICRLCGERLNDARAWLAKATTGKRASHHSRQDKQEPIGLVQTSARSGLELSQQGPAVVVTKLSPLGCRSGVQSRRLKSGDWRSLSRPTRRRALQQIEDPARRTRSTAQRRRGSRRSGSGPPGLPTSTPTVTSRSPITVAVARCVVGTVDGRGIVNARCGGHKGDHWGGVERRCHHVSTTIPPRWSVSIVTITRTTAGASIAGRRRRVGPVAASVRNQNGLL
jgi:hypothetical protein